MPKVQSVPKPATTTPPAAAKKNRKPKPEAVERKVIYPNIEAKVFIGDGAMTCEMAKQYMGWDEIPENDKKSEHHLKDRNDKRIRLLHNPKNRKFKPNTALMYMQLILTGQWELNLEAMIFGKTGLVISAQHRLCALILACQEWAANSDDYPFWKTEPTMQCICNFGCEETDRVVNTIDTGEPRTYSDAVYRSEYFATLPMSERDVCSKITARAVNWIQNRTDARVNSISDKQPHAEAFEFLDAHPHILKAIKHVFIEDKSGKLSQYVPAGFAAAMMFLMGTGQTDPKKYRSADRRTEKALNFDNWHAAETFIVELAGGEKKFAPVREAVGRLKTAVGRITRDEGIGMMVKAWLCVCAGKPVDVNLRYEISVEDGIRRLVEFPSVGGIDLGNKTDEPEESTDDPTPEQIEERGAAIRNGKAKGKKGPPAKVGDMVWIEDDGGHFAGKVTEIYDAPGGKVAKILMGNNKSTEAKLSECLMTDPNAV